MLGSSLKVCLSPWSSFPSFNSVARSFGGVSANLSSLPLSLSARRFWPQIAYISVVGVGLRVASSVVPYLGQLSLVVVALVSLEHSVLCGAQVVALVVLVVVVDRTASLTASVDSAREETSLLEQHNKAWVTRSTWRLRADSRQQ